MTGLRAPAREHLPPSATVAFRRCMQHLHLTGERAIVDLLDNIGREIGGRGAVLDLLAAFEPRLVSAMFRGVGGDRLPLQVMARSIAIAKVPASCVALVSWCFGLHASLPLLGCAELHCNGRIAPRIPIPRLPDGSIIVGVSTSPKIDREYVLLRDSAASRRFPTILKFSGDGEASWDRMILDALADGGTRP